MNDVTILDLFWFILKLLAALGLVCLIGVAIILIWAGANRAARTTWNILGGRGRDASTAAIVSFVLVLMALVGGVMAAVDYLHDHPNLFH